MSSNLVRRVGYWWSEKKSRKFNFTEFSNVCRLSGLELVKIDLERPLNEQGPFAAIVHKLTDVILKADKGDLKSKAICQSFQEYSKKHPEVVFIDSLPNIEKLLDRYAQYNCVEDSELRKEGAFIPPFVELTTTNVSENLAKMVASGVTFPCVCKPSVAHGSLAHELCLIFNKEGLKDITVPCVVQKFINHNAVLYKVFIIANKFFVIERPSLKNFYAGDTKTIFFHSRDISKPHSASALTELDESEPPCLIVWPDKDRIAHIVQILYNGLGLTLFGIDIVVDNNTGRYAIIDMNYFPGYDEVDDFFQILCDVILEGITIRVSGNYETTINKTLANISLPKLDDVQPISKSFTFDTVPRYRNEKSMALVPYIPQCFCCPISGSCNNAESKVPISKEVPNNEMSSACTKMCSKTHKSQDVFQINSIGPTCFKSHSPDSSTQDDSGIETSDSCDEKKKKSGFRTCKRQHSRNVYNQPSL